MTITLTRRSIRVSAATAIAAIGLLGLVACSSSEPQAEEKPKASTSTEAESSEDTENTEEAAATGATKCTEEQIATLSSAAGTTIPPEAMAAAKASFVPEAVVGDLQTTCVLTIENAGATASYAVLPGGAASLTAAAANATAAGAEITEVEGTFTGSIEGATISGVSFTELTQETAGFENVEDLVVIVATKVAA